MSFPYPCPETHHNLVLLLDKEKENFDFWFGRKDVRSIFLLFLVPRKIKNEDFFLSNCKLRLDIIKHQIWITVLLIY